MATPSSAGGGWECQRCTYYHHHAADRCAMCHNLRVSKQQMTNFIRGIPIPKERPPKHNPYAKKKKATAQMTLSGAGAPLTRQPPSLKPPPNNNNAATMTTMMIRSESEVSKGSQATKIATNMQQRNENGRRPGLGEDYPRKESTSMPKQTNGRHEESNPPFRLHMESSSRRPAPGTIPPAKQQQTIFPEPSAPNGATSVRFAATPATAKVNSDAAAPDSKRRSSGSFRPPYRPGPVPLDTEAAKEWIYPTDHRFPRRAYQFEISQTALLHNTLVGLPTGLGKTMIAAVVLYNYYRWFPTGKVVFMAPTLPLVNQQVKACFDIVGIPEQETAVLTGKVLAVKREAAWAERRAFFCTPQTMDKDLEAQRVDPKRIVLIVLDEAHRARGEYAYNKIISRLEEGEARFRVLGLSATPGSRIQIIQEVVDSLRINRVESRSEEDPDVKKYVHEKQTEVVLVKKESACRDIERIINDILEPLLRTLRHAGGLKHFSNSTLTQWMLLKARNDFTARTGRNDLYGVFEAARSFVELRTALHSQGIGIFRTRILRLQQETRVAEIKRIAKTPGFQSLVRKVLQSTTDPHAAKGSVADRIANNPKLQKLQEILVEHFERARSRRNGEPNSSTRAIVFSQFRDSVGEIVDILDASRPLIRPRHFVGQSKGGDNANKTQLKGMSQSEQHQVIKQFRDDVYNVLVCTCIGEEGLDIGEVDLIVNFDSLTSPVRMIQRVGRTGRKRDGRVVCLVSEGAEERTYKEFKQKEKTIMRAMKRPDAFKVCPTVPMLPHEPKLLEQNMDRSVSFHLSQVEGHANARKSTKNNSKLVRGPSRTNGWKLTPDKQARRRAILGKSNLVKSGQSSSLWEAVKKRTLAARSTEPDFSTHRLNERSGTVTNFLWQFEQNHQSGEKRPGKRSRRSLRGRGVDPMIDTWFPMTSDERNFEDLAWDRSILFPEKPSDAAIQSRSRSSEKGGLERDKEQVEPTNGARQAPSNLSEPKSAHLPLQVAQGHQHATLPTRAAGNYEVQARPGIAAKSLDVQQTEQTHKPVSRGSDAFVAREAFRLPTPPPSSDEEDYCDAWKVTEKHPEVPPAKSRALEPQTDPSRSKHTEPRKSSSNFILPPQLSSDSEDESEVVEMRKPARYGDALNTSSASALTNTPDSSEVIEMRKPATYRHALNESLTSALTDTPDSCEVVKARKPAPSEDALNSSLNTVLTNTPESSGAPIANGESADDIVCAICQSGASPDEDPIVLCDGPGNGVECNLAIHATCYSVEIDLSLDEDWRCFPCLYKYLGGKELVACRVCEAETGPLKRNGKGGWVHVFCDQQNVGKPSSKPGAKLLERRRRLKKLKRKAGDRQHQGKKRQKLRGNTFVDQFLDEEASLDSDEDMDGDAAEDDEILAIEEEEALHSSFINDSAELGFSPDALDQIDPNDDTMHRVVDEERDRQNKFKTPVFNRLMKGESASGDDDEFVPSSEKGLGRMHFIRSVIEHHRQGGTADELERAFGEIHGGSGDEANNDDDGVIRERPGPAREVLPAYEDSDEDEH